MSRYDREESPDEIRESSVRLPAEFSGDQDTSDARGQGGGGETSHHQPPQREIRPQEQTASARNPELKERDHATRERTYDLRDSEVQTLADIGALRAIKAEDLVEHRYDGDTRQGRRDLKHLLEQGLVQSVRMAKHTVDDAWEASLLIVRPVSASGSRLWV